MCKCLYCYKPLKEGEKDFHAVCAKRFFGSVAVPELDYTAEQLDELALQIIKDQTSLTGVQPKLPLHLTSHEGSSRLTIVGLWGAFICKPQTTQFPQLPEVEDLTMHLAEEAKIAVVPHSLMRMKDGALCYLTRRIDRAENGEKIAMEDMCQLTERQMEDKYRSSYERIGKAIAQFSSVPKLDVTDFFEVVLFSWITGNNDMHLKNFSLYEPISNKWRLAPAYDLLNVAIINPKDNEELALTLNGRKRKIKRSDFLEAGESMGVDAKTIERLLQKYIKLRPSFEKVIATSYLSESLKQEYSDLLNRRIDILQ